MSLLGHRQISGLCSPSHVQPKVKKTNRAAPDSYLDCLNWAFWYVCTTISGSRRLESTKDIQREEPGPGRANRSVCAEQGADGRQWAQWPKGVPSLGTGTWRLGPFVLLGLSRRHERVLLSRKKKKNNSGEAPDKHNSPRFCWWFFFTCTGCGGLGPSSFSMLCFCPSGGTRGGTFHVSLCAF